MTGRDLLSWLNRLSNEEIDYEVCAEIDCAVNKCKYTVEDPVVNKQDKRIIL